MQSEITPLGTLPPPVPNETKPTFGSQSSAPPVPTGSKPRGMQLGVHRTAPGALPGGLVEEVRWGGNLMDVNADADDWSTYLRLSLSLHPLIDLTQTNSRVRHQSRVAPMPLGWAGPAHQMTRTRGQPSKIPHHPPCLFLSQSSHHPYPQLLRHRLRHLRGRLPPRWRGPHVLQRSRPLQVLTGRL